jgi:hypothetical protein
MELAPLAAKAFMISRMQNNRKYTRSKRCHAGSILPALFLKLSIRVECLSNSFNVQLPTCCIARIGQYEHIKFSARVNLP